MKKLLLLTIPVLLLFSCRTSMKKASAWLDAVQGEPKINIEGEWSNEEWGTGVFIQKGNRITGALGSYEVQGAVNGEKVYLLLGYYNTFYYAAILEPYKNILIGKYSDSKPKNDHLRKDALPITLSKVREIK